MVRGNGRPGKLMLYGCLLLYLGLIYIRPAEIVASWATFPFVDVLSVIAAVVAVISLALKPRPIFNLPHDKFLLAFWTIIPIASFKVWLWLVYFSWVSFMPSVFCYFLVRAGVRTVAHFRKLIYVLVALNVFLAVNGIVQHHTGTGLGNVMMKNDRIYGTGIFNDPNDLGMTFVMVVPLLLVMMGRSAAGVLSRIAAAVGLGLVLLALYYTNSRGAIVGLGGVIVAYSFLRLPKVRAFAIALVLLAIVSVAGPSRAGQIDSGEESAQTRIQSWAAGWVMLKMHPLTGVGWGQYTEFNETVAHNSFVHTFAELGLAGAFCFVGLFYWYFKGVQPSATLRSDLRPWREALTASAAGVLVCAWFLSRQYVPVLYVLLSLGACAFVLDREPGQARVSIRARDMTNIAILTIAGVMIVYVSVRTLAVWGK